MDVIVKKKCYATFMVSKSNNYDIQGVKSMELESDGHGLRK
jgi:hypothetical protein